jgi:hypothetical protein
MGVFCQEAIVQSLLEIEDLNQWEEGNDKVQVLTEISRQTDQDQEGLCKIYHF